MERFIKIVDLSLTVLCVLGVIGVAALLVVGALR